MSDKMYILMNKEENRIRIEDDTLPHVLSGKLNITMLPVSFKPKEYTSQVRAWLAGLGYSRTIVEVTETSSWTRNRSMDYWWMKDLHTGVVHRIWNESFRGKPNNCSLLLDDTYVMIKGIGTFPLDQFIEFNF